MPSDETGADHTDEGKHYVGVRWDDETPQTLRLECQDCGEIWTDDNTEDGYNRLDTIRGRHLDDGEFATPCDRTQLLGIWESGETAEVA